MTLRKTASRWSHDPANWHETGSIAVAIRAEYDPCIGRTSRTACERREPGRRRMGPRFDRQRACDARGPPAQRAPSSLLGPQQPFALPHDRTLAVVVAGSAARHEGPLMVVGLSFCKGWRVGPLGRVPESSLRAVHEEPMLTVDPIRRPPPVNRSDRTERSGAVALSDRGRGRSTDSSDSSSLPLRIAARQLAASAASVQRARAKSFPCLSDSNGRG